LHTFKVPREGRFDTSTSPFNCSDILNCFPALRTIDLMFTKRLYVAELFATFPQVRECTLRFNNTFSFSEMMMYMMNDVIHLKKLALHNIALNDTTLCSILTLPQLQHLSFHNVYKKFGFHHQSILHPDQYPTIQLAPLKEFAYDVSGTDNYVGSHPQYIRIFLHRFVTLQMDEMDLAVFLLKTMFHE